MSCYPPGAVLPLAVASWSNVLTLCLFLFPTLSMSPVELYIAGWEFISQLDKVLTYNNLIYLLNFPFYCINTSSSSERMKNNKAMDGGYLTRGLIYELWLPNWFQGIRLTNSAGARPTCSPHPFLPLNPSIERWWEKNRVQSQDSQGR